MVVNCFLAPLTAPSGRSRVTPLGQGIEMKDFPELQGIAPEEAERLYKRAELEARKDVEDRANQVAMTTWGCLAGAGGIVGGVHGAAGAAVGAMLGFLIGSGVGAIYKRQALNRATRTALRRQLTRSQAL